MEKSMIIFTIVLLALIAVAHVVMGTIIYKKAPRAMLNRLCLGFALNASLWSVSVLFVILQNDYEQALFWIRMSHALAATTPSFMFALVYCFKAGIKYPYRKVFWVFLFSLALALLCLTPAVIKDVVLAAEGKIKIYGPVFPLYTIFFAVVPVLSLYNLFRQLRQSRGLVRFQIRYFFGGILIAFILGSLVNLFLPLMGITTDNLRSLGPVFTLISVISITYAIAKYRLMDISLALRRIIANSLSIMLVAGIYILAIFLAKKQFMAYSDYLTLFLIILLVVSFQTIKNQVQSLIDRYFFRGAYNYFTTLRNVTKAMVSILNREKLLSFLTDKIMETIYIRGAAFFLREQDGSFTAVTKKYLAPFLPLEKEYSKLEPENPLILLLEKRGDVLLKTDLRGVEPEEKRELLVGEMKKLHSEVAVPLFIEGKMDGVFFLGYKLSGEPYSKEDVNLLSTLSYQIAVSLKNARLYHEILEIKQYLENVLENMGNGLIAVNAGGRITTFNSTAEKLTGLKAREVLGKKVDKTLDPGLSWQLLQTLNNGQRRSEVEVEVPVGNLTCFLCCSTALVELNDSRERGAIMALSDITRIKELEREKSEVQRLASLGEMAAGMAHEIKNPLVSIKTFAELLPEKYENHEFRYSFSQIVSQEIERINNLVMGLLKISRDQQVYNYDEVNIEVLLDEIFLLVLPQLNAQNIGVYKHYEPDVPVIQADREQLKQALFNICLNGIQAMPGGGELRVEILPVMVLAGETAGVLSPGKKVKIVIEDTGIGISSPEKEKIFDPFFTTKADGVGIGLSISHRVITSHGGSIQVRSSKGEGTVFEIYLPAGD
ncbi:MAG: PAS domain-containing protein [Dethiobacter sp.]|jgi:PAS domain S-box-containing protein|nr:MAG: PAS domain-containing protein [Dethiobacter sp.]